ncbi:MAG TPA: DUF4349 domain-containing protein [Candidatus Baltobacteraceae bacterium]|nr:DUF4349 domain-containing protein [Candidatus Baltobacteraceae bacterium]
MIRMIASTRSIAHPLAAVAIAVVIVIVAAAFGSSFLTTRSSDIALKGKPTIERVAITKRVSVPLKLNVPHAHIAAVQSSSGVPAASSNASSASSSAEPLIARTAKLSLYVQNVDKAARAVAAAAKGNGGDVFSSDISSGDDSAGQSSGNMSIRVPASRFDAAMAAVAGAGKVREQSTSAEDESGDITDTAARLRNLRQTEEDIRRIMNRSGNVAQIMDAENQLSQVREQIETQESDLSYMRSRVAYATIDVDLQAEAANVPVQPTAASQIANAWHTALASLAQMTIGIVALLLWVAVFVPYVLLAAALFWLVYAQVRKRLLRA